ncbi:non-ribosomal peptide synthetase [Pseudoalteromonas luteoviolacea]|uniref:non-ribosomal peptide synthetase n=1 Tax=Pseudoalteromonas luteoviolacea TaxID=43657 RepID=UPI001B390141|nr:non-ribosomal peptide synthetase [Pseudoalteromonas luteoviolacea]MBQ4834748.1 amino acid adenylation domain-containing protein [Pseudoalteromonas luteoviolacea]
MKAKNVLKQLYASGIELILENERLVTKSNTPPTDKQATLINQYEQRLIDYIKLQDTHWRTRLSGYEPMILHSMCLPCEQRGVFTQYWQYSELKQPKVSTKQAQFLLQSRVLYALNQALSTYSGQADNLVKVFLPEDSADGFQVCPVRSTAQGKSLTLEQFTKLYRQDIEVGYLDTSALNSYNLESECEVVWQGLQEAENHSPSLTEKQKIGIDIRLLDRKVVFTWRWNGQLISERSVKVISEIFASYLVGTPASIPEFSAIKNSYQEDKSALQLFAQVSSLYSDKVAVRCQERQLTYRELKQQAESIAASLQSAGMLAGDRIVVILPRNIDLLLAIVGILFTGAVYIPVSPKESEERVNTVVEQSGAKAVICLDFKSTLVCRQFTLEQLRSRSDKAYQGAEVAADSPFYINFSSGSTGKPKGIVCSHQGITRLVINPNFTVLDENTNMLCIANQSFDAFAFEIWGALLNGGCLYMLEEACVTPENLGTLFSTQVNTCFLTAALFHTLVDIDPCLFSGLKQLLVGGDVVLPSKVKLVYQNNSDIQIVNAYGPTENTVFTSTFLIPKTWSSNQPLPIGLPINGTAVAIVSDKGAYLPHGCVGEIVTAGSGLALGYLNKSQESGRFVSMDCGDKPLRVYKTGDLGFIDSQGDIRFIGRRDAQVKINGYRVELQAIDQTLEALPEIKQAHTLAIAAANGHKLVSFIQLNEPHHQNDANCESVLVHYLEAELPAHMVPSSLCFITHIPLTLNGKLDKQSLIELFTQQSQSQYVAPTTPLQIELCKLFAQVLHVKRLGIADDLIQLGGNSLMFLRILAICRETLQLEITLNELLLNPNIAAISHLARRKNTPSITKASEQQLSFAEERLLFIQGIKEAECAYNAPFLFELSPEFDCDKFLSAFEQVAARHTILKTQYRWNDARQVYPKISESKYALHHEKVDSEQALQMRLKYFANEPFDLSEELPVKFVLLEKTDSRQLLLNIHHVVIDGWSLNILFNELTYFYAGKGEVLPLKISYRDYASWQREELKGTTKADLTAFWQRYLAGNDTLLLPYDAPRGKSFDYKGKSQYIKLDKSLSQALRQSAKAHSTTLYHVMLSTFFALSHKLSQQHDLILGTPFENRYEPETQSLIGFFVNSLPIRVVLQNDDVSLRELLQLTINSVSEVREHQALPLNDIVQATGTEFDASRAPLFQVLFSVQAFLAQKDLPSGMTLEHVRAYTAAKYDMTILIDDSKTEIEIDWNYASALFKCESVTRFAQMYKRVLTQFTEQPSTKLSELIVIDEKEQRLLLDVWGRPQNSKPLRHLSLPALFEEQANIHPEQTALRYKGESLSYHQLNSRANQLAHGLLACFNRSYLPQQAHIAVFKTRGIDMVVSALAVLKLGAAVVMVSPDYPQHRIDTMLQDCQPLCVITDEHHVDKIRDLGCGCVIFQQVMSKQNLAHNLASVVNLDTMAYVIYTSGTTGTPKGVKTSHRGVVSLIQNNGYVEFSSQDRLVQLANPNFDMALFETWGALCHGATLVIPEQQQPSFEDIRALLRRESITILWLTTSLFDGLHSYDPSCFANLKYLIFGGEAANCDTVAKLQASESCPEYLINGYGPSESTIVTTHCCHGFTGTNVPIGKPANSRNVYVLDRHKRPVPIGVIGELYVAGEGVSDGYLNRLELTNERFLPDPFSDSEDGKMYRTGDLVRWRLDGNLEYLGRNDNQVKINGYRIELGEIENVLLQNSDINSVAVVDVEHHGHTYLVAYICSTNQQLSLNDVRSNAEQQLPRFMHPSEYIQIDSLPYTLNGKLDKNRLPKVHFESQRNYVAPRDQFELQLCALFRQLLGAPKVGIDDDFFELGGHSMLAMQLAHKIEHLTGQAFSLRSLYSHRTVRQLSEFKPKTKRFVEPSQFALPVHLSPLKRNIECVQTIFLTGATGFVGRYLLAQLLTAPDAIIYCLVRASDSIHGKARIEQSLKQAHLWRDEFTGRINAVEGDLSQAKLGMSEQSYTRVAEQVDLIIHAATYMDHLAQFEQMKPANVDSTIELITLQQHRKAKRLLHISTTAVLKQREVADELTPLELQSHTACEGYVSTKWASELLIKQAQQRGFDISVIRLGLISGCVNTGLSDHEQWLTMLMKLTSHLGLCFDDKRFQTSIIPVNYVAQAIGTLIYQSKLLPVYHLSNSRELYFVDLVRARNKVLEAPITLTSYKDFIAALVALKETGKAITGEYLFTDDMRQVSAEHHREESSVFAPIDATKTWQSLEKLNLPMPALTDVMIAQYFDAIESIE